MKTWILKNDLSRSPQAAFRTYICGCKKSKHNDEKSFFGRPKHYFLARKLKSQIKTLTRILNLGGVADAEEDCG
jgi:hypothetical protein